MIPAYKHIPPFIDFGFGLTTLTVPLNKNITVWLNTIYNKEAYNFNLASQGAASVNTISVYEYQLKYTQTGTYHISLTVTAKDATASLESNILTLTVV